MTPNNTTTGILKLMPNGGGNLHNLPHFSDKIHVSPKLIRSYKLSEGAMVTGLTQHRKNGPELISVDTICGLSPEIFQNRTRFKQLTAISPCDRFNLSVSNEISMRAIDLVAPIGKGTRGLIVAPSKAGKTTLLGKIAKAIQTDAPQTRLIVLLIDERPEEVTHLRRSLPNAEVFASSSDRPVEEHMELSELMLAHIRTELECGHDVVVLVDSLTRLVRAFNLGGRGRNRTLSGGVDAQALQIPRRFFGLARNIENGGSVTILATILVNTGSRMDDFIFEEFKGTGNNEIVLDRSLAEAYIYPAINLLASGTRRETELYHPDNKPQVDTLRRKLADRSPKEAMLLLLNLLEEYPTNVDLLNSFKRKH